MFKQIKVMTVVKRGKYKYFASPLPPWIYRLDLTITTSEHAHRRNFSSKFFTQQPLGSSFFNGSDQNSSKFRLWLKIIVFIIRQKYIHIDSNLVLELSGSIDINPAAKLRFREPLHIQQILRQCFYTGTEDSLFLVLT